MITVTVVGSVDRQLEELLRGAGMHPMVIDEMKLSMLAAPGARLPDVIVLDVRHGTGIPAAIAGLKRQHPSTGIVVVAQTLDPGMLLEAMRAGINEVVTNPISQGDLENAIARVLAQRPENKIGQVFGFVGAKGGVGTTTMAVNVAVALAGASQPERTLLIDFHQTSGDAALFVGAEPRFSVIDALENTRRLDQTFFRGLVSPVATGLDLLASSERPVAGQSDPGKIRAVIDFVVSSYRYTVVDLPRSNSAVLDALDGVKTIVIVANQEFATVRSASRLAATLRNRYGPDRISVVVSRSDREAEIGQADIERAVGSKVIHVIPSDYRRALQALNKGRPLTVDNHNELSAAIRRFAFELAGIHPERTEPSRARFLGRLTLGRRS